jgi:hypothetical protein
MTTRLWLLGACLLTLAASAAEPVAPVEVPTVSPSDWLKAQAAPVFKVGHTLPPLTRYGWTMTFETRVELTERWGYALEFGGYVTPASVAKLADPASDEARLAALAAADPKRYPLTVICSRELPKDNPPETWTRDADGHFLDAKAHSLDGTVWQTGMKTVYSPEAPDSVWQGAGQLRADPIKAVRAVAPIAVVLNGGEYGLGVLGFAQTVWEKDPAILKAKGETPWFDYISARKARAETLIADAVKAVVPDRQLYIYYPTSGGPHRLHSADWDKWCYGYEWMKPVSDLASSEFYYRHFNSGWTGHEDLLTEATNAKAWQIVQGQPLSYDWLCAGWPREKGLGAGAADLLGDGGLGDIARYTGFLKCLYTLGMVGGNAGYYARPKGGFGIPFPPDQPPHWMQQMVAFSQVHALFSHLEKDLREGDLLPGPAKHVWSKNEPAYEFPVADKTIRVLARRQRGAATWLLTAWAAAGDERQATVTIPDLGEVTLLARPAGSVYHAVLVEGQPRQTLLDVNALAPTVGLKGNLP